MMEADGKLRERRLPSRLEAMIAADVCVDSMQALAINESGVEEREFLPSEAGVSDLFELQAVSVARGDPCGVAAVWVMMGGYQKC